MARHRLTPAKRYCSKPCASRAYYLRRKERVASEPVVIEQPRAVGVDGWPDEAAQSPIDKSTQP